MQTVFVGISGGVDSAVSAHLLKQAGHHVVGVFLKVWEPDFLPCTGAEDRLDAMRVAAHLGIPFKTYDVEEEYRRGVVQYLLDEYSAGRTPNPDVMCNREVKFGIFWQKAKADGANYIATGHYAHSRQRTVDSGQWALSRGRDSAKDQSYFLWTLTQEDLAHTLFPLGDLQKSQVRKIAAQIGLPNASKRDSQGICFLGHVDMKEFLKRYIPVERGPIVNTEGEVLGEHEGVILYTLGQRVSIAGGERLYVIEKNIKTNTLVVSNTAIPEGSGSTEVSIYSVNWIDNTPAEGAEYTAQLRYHGERHPVHIKSKKEETMVLFQEAVQAVPGQSLVVYDGDRCLGGGIILGS